MMQSSIILHTTTLAALALSLLSNPSSTANAFYVPGVKPETFKEGDDVPLKVNSMTSIHTQVPKDYYRLPFCVPDGGPKMASENLGEFLTGNKVQNSPYTINMLKEVHCQRICQVTPDEKEAKFLMKHIRQAYRNNWIIDNLPSASFDSTEKGRKQHHYAGGFPIGFVELKTDGKIGKKTKFSKMMENKALDTYVFNHASITLDYHTPDKNVDGHRVVGFSVEPLSANHKFAGGFDWDGKSEDASTKQLETCPSGSHLKKKDIRANQIVKAGEKILYTYDVTWKYSEIAWSSRWDIYLSENNQVPATVHWYSITNSILVVLFMSVLILSILVRNLRKDIAGYNALEKLTDEEQSEDADEHGWKLVHADVFRPPQNFPMLYCAMVGSGLQITISAVGCLIFSAIGFVNPSRRGSFMMAMLILFMFCGILAGYVSSRLYKSFRGRSWQLCTVLTATGFPGICFAVFLFFNTVLAFFHSSGSVPFLETFIMAAMWCCVSIPLVFIGAYFGYKKDSITFPTVTSTIARAIPPTTMLLNPTLNICFAGVVPFATAYVELFFIMTSLWMDQYYYVFGFTFTVFVILLITCAELTVFLVYYQLCAENHRWWWFSFYAGGSVSGYVFLYSIVWFKSLQASKMIITYLLYFGYMYLISLALFLMTGMFSTLVSLFFVRKIFSTIKVD